jgi:hypothetical protein
MPSVSHSEVDSYLLCRRKHYYGYGLSLQRVKESSSLATGVAGHKILEAFYRAILNAGHTVEEQQAAFDEGVQAAFQAYDELKPKATRTVTDEPNLLTSSSTKTTDTSRTNSLSTKVGVS